MAISGIERDFYAYACGALARFHEQQEGVVSEAARLIAHRLSDGGRFLVTGTGHSHMLAEELYTRAGGLACVTPILPSEFQLFEHPLKSTEVERLEAYAAVVMRLYAVSGQDALLIASNSGRNGMTVELARQARRKGAVVVAFTGMRRTEGERSRHSGGLFLKDEADVVIDTCTPPGDAGFYVEEAGAHMGALSTFVGVYMAQLLAIGIARALSQSGTKPPVFKSSNIDGGDEWNHALFQRYLGVQHNIFLEGAD